MKKCYVLYADIMGFKERVKAKEHGELLNEMSRFVKEFNVKTSSLKLGNHLSVSIFSDSILITSDDDSEGSVNLITKAGARLMHVALEQGMALKGAIALGMFTHMKEEQLYVGAPLVDAYLLHDELKFYGIAVHHSAESGIKNYIKQSKYAFSYHNSKISLRQGCVSHYHLCWNLITKKLDKGNITETAHRWLSSIEESVSGMPRIYIDNTRKILKQDEDAYNAACKARG